MKRLLVILCCICIGAVLGYMKFQHDKEESRMDTCVTLAVEYDGLSYSDAEIYCERGE